MWRLNIPVRTELVQWSRIRGHAKPQKPRFIPHFDGFRKWSRREDAMTHGANSVAGNFRANRISNSRSKQQFFRRRYLRERHHLIPHFLRWRVHLNRRAHPNVSAGGVTQRSAPWKAGVNNKMIDSITGVSLFSQYPA